MKTKHAYTVYLALLLSFVGLETWVYFNSRPVSAQSSNQVQGVAATGSSATGIRPVLVGVVSGGNVAAFPADSTGLKVQGTAAALAAPSGNPLLNGGWDEGGNIVRRFPVTVGGAVGVGNAAHMAVIGGTDSVNAQVLRLDGSGRPVAVGGAANGAAPSGNPVLIAGYDFSSGLVGWFPVTTDGVAPTRFIPMAGWDGTNSRGLKTDTNGSLATAHYNGASIEREYNNWTQTAIASTVYNSATTTNSSDLTNFNARGCVLNFDCTAFTAGGTATTLNVQTKAGSDYKTIYSFTATPSGTGLQSFLIYPGAASAASWTSAPLQGTITRTFRVQVVTTGSPNYTATFYVDLLN